MAKRFENGAVVLGPVGGRSAACDDLPLFQPQLSFRCRMMRLVAVAGAGVRPKGET